MVTLQDIADQAGVSISTVSRVLSGVESTVPISESTKQKVMDISENLEYYPNVAARALSSRRAGAIGLIIPAGKPERHFQRFYELKLHEVLAGIERVASEANLNLILQVANKRFLAGQGLARMYYGRLVDTLILYEVALAPEKIPGDCPAILLNTRNNEKDKNYVIADDRDGAQRAVDYLSNLGHKNIGFISGPNQHFVSQERKRGYEAAITSHGLKPYLYVGDLTEESGVRGTRKLLPQDDGVTAIFIAGDYMAIGALKAAREMGISVPEQLSIMGADGMQVAAYTTPAITTVVTALYSMSRIAAGWAVKLINEETQESVQEIFPTEIEERESCAPPPHT